jgi:hypothetical protein
MLMASRLTPALRERVRRANVSVVEKPLLSDALIKWIRKAFFPAIGTGADSNATATRLTTMSSTMN